MKDSEPVYEIGMCDRCASVYDAKQLLQVAIIHKQWSLCEECIEGLEHYLRGWSCDNSEATL